MKYLIVCVLALFFAQILKPFFHYLNKFVNKEAFEKNKISWRSVFMNGGMPSSHSATVSALFTQILLSESDLWNSKYLAIAGVLAFIVAWDAKSLRRGVGEIGNMLNELGFNVVKNFVKENYEEKYEFKPLKVVLGHTKLQVLMGVLLGILVGYVGFHYFK